MHLVQPCSLLLTCVIIACTMSNIREIPVTGTLIPDLGGNLVISADPGNIKLDSMTNTPEQIKLQVYLQHLKKWTRLSFEW